jgi:hypothetical protein
MSRPWARPKPKPVREPPKTLQQVTLTDLFTDRQNSLTVGNYGL